LRAHILPRFDAKTAEILLHEIDVLSEYQERGIATALVEEPKEIAVEMNASEIWVITNRSNQAACACTRRRAPGRLSPMMWSSFTISTANG
jgi:ribosomal protein S18 acetylase RimI-like enzyme